MILAPKELEALTRRKRPSAQARVLRLLGIAFAVHPIDRTLLVHRDAWAAVLSGKPAAGAFASTASPVVDVAAIRAHGELRRRKLVAKERGRG